MNTTQHAVSTTPSSSVLSNLKKKPKVRDWLDLSPTGELQIHTGKVEIGQGILHALMRIACDELGLSPSGVKALAANTTRSPDEAVTSGSLSVQDSGATVRHVCAYVREACLQVYAQQRCVAKEAVLIKDGQLKAGAHSAQLVSFITDALLDATVSLQALPTKPTHDNPDVLLLNKSPAFTQRQDIAQKIMGQFEYIQDLVKPQMSWGLVLHPRTLKGQLIPERLSRFERLALNISGIERVVYDGALVGVLASSEHDLTRCAALLELESLWDESLSAIPSELQNNQHIGDWLQAQPLESQTITSQGVGPYTARVSSTTTSPSDLQGPAVSVTASFTRPFVQHASIGLSTAWARWRGDDKVHGEPSQLEVISHSQGIYNLRRDLGLAFGLPEQSVTVEHHAGAGCYGHNGADDVAYDAAWLARFKPEYWVRVQWRREDELGLSPMSAAMAVKITATASESGQLLSWETDLWSQGHGTRPGRESTPALLGAWQVDQSVHAAPILVAVNAPLQNGGGAERNAVPLYDIPNWAVYNHRVLSTPFRVSALRSLGAQVNVFALESVIDLLAERLNMDPLTFRLNNLKDPRARAVLARVAQMSNWSALSARERLDGEGWGLGFAKYKNSSAYCAVVAHVKVSETVQVMSLDLCADIGQVVHEDGANNQIEGGAIQAMSLTLLEQAQLGLDGVRSKDWAHYPIARFGQTPTLKVSLIDPMNSPSSGAGECSIGPTAAALANAVSQAISARIYNMPLNAENLLQSLES